MLTGVGANGYKEEDCRPELTVDMQAEIEPLPDGNEEHASQSQGKRGVGQPKYRTGGNAFVTKCHECTRHGLGHASKLQNM